MKNMTFKEKFFFIFLQIITLGLIWIHWKKQGKKYQNKNELSQEVKVGLNVIKLIQLCGGPQNVSEVSNTHTKIKIKYEIRERIKVDEIKKMNGISGIFLNDLSLTIIVGNSAEATRKLIEQYLIN